MRYVFADCVLDGSCFELRREGRLVKLEPRVFDVLWMLVENRDRVVSKHELLDTLWPGEAVSDSVLPRCIAAARRGVGDSRARQAVIQTAHGRGYRFVADACAEATARPAPAVASPGAASTPDARAPVFVGREDALARLLAALERAVAGRGGIALVVGEPGIGKTRTTEELARRACDRGVEVLSGGGYEGDGAPAYWPWVQILRAALAGSDDEQLREQLGIGAADLAELVPELRQRLEGLPTPSGPLGEQARFRLFDAITRFAIARSQRQPLLLIVDDLHWADASSLGMLRFLASQLAGQRILVVATYRDVEVRRGHPLAEVLGQLARTPECERVALSGLCESEIAQLVLAIAGETPDPALTARLREMTEGNPFFVREMVRLLADRGPVREASGETIHALSLPQGIRDAIGRRLDALSQACNTALCAAAVLGREFAGSSLESMLELAGGDRAEGLLELLAEALDAGILVEARRGRYAFAHALTRQTLYEELRAPQRIALHRRAASALERAVGGLADEYLPELAHHFFEAAPGGDVDKAIDYCVAAAAAAHRQHAYQEAIGQRERALEAEELAMPRDPGRRAGLLIALGQELFVAGERDRAHETLLAGAERARAADRIDLVAEAAIALRGFGEVGTPAADGHRELIEEALACLPEDAASLRARLIARLGGFAGTAMSQRDRLSAEALDLAIRSGDPIALRDALAARWWATLGPDRLEERGRIADRMRALAKQLDDPHVALLGLECELGSSLALGDADRTERIIDEYEALATELRQPLFLFMAMQFRVSWAMMIGDFEQVDRLLEQAIAYGRGRVPFAELVYAGQRYWSQLHRAEPDRLAEIHDDLDALLLGYFSNETVLGIFAATILSTTHESLEPARERLSSVDYRSLEHDEHWLLAMGVLADLAYELRDREILVWLYAELEPYAELMCVHDLLRATSGSMRSCLGEVATGLGRYDEAIEHYERALERERAARARPSMAQSLFGLARALVLRGAPGDSERAEEWMAQASVLSEEMGTRHYEQARRRLDALRG